MYKCGYRCVHWVLCVHVGGSYESGVMSVW